MSGSRGAFFCLEGVDKAGKTTQVDRLERWLREQGRECVRLREPGGTEIGERIRELLLSRESRMGPTCEMLLYMASRAELVEQVVRPALEASRVVLTDRFLLSTLAYQGYAGGVAVETIRAVGQVATGGIEPDWIGVLDLDPEEAARRGGEPPDRIESRSLEYRRQVREAYLTEAKRDPTRIVVLDAKQDPDSLETRIRAEVQRVLGGTRFGGAGRIG